MSRTEFWSMHPEELWWLVEANKPRRMYGSLSEDDAAELYRDMYGEPADD